MPVVSNVRKSARSTACLANLQQWGVAYQAYLVGNHNKPMSDAGDYMVDRRWWEWLRPFTSDVRQALLCPEARQRRADQRPLQGEHFVNPGNAECAWASTGITEDAVGSYGFNHWLYSPSKPFNSNPYFHYPIKNAANVPVLGDCTIPYALAVVPDRVPTNLYDPDSIGVESYCMDRHRMAINVVFLDGHAEHLPLATLWKLKWSPNSKPTEVVVR